MSTERAYHPVTLVAWGVFIESMRRRDFYVLLILVGLFSVGVIVSRMAGADTPASAGFLVNLGMSMAFLCAAILAVLTSARLLPAEFENRTIYPLLAKPLSRSQLLLGKWAATSCVAIASMLALFLVAWLPAPKSDGLSTVLLLQTLLAKSAALAMLSALGILFSLLMPMALNIVMLALVYTGSETAGNFARAKALHTPLSDVVRWAAYYLPRFDMLDLTKRYTDEAIALSGTQFAGLLAYPIIATVFVLSLACIIFDRRVI